MPITWQAEDTTEPIADTTIEGIANFQNYSTVSGCAATYNGATMVVAIAAGSVLHNGSVVTVAGNNVTLVSDATNPRWTWIGISSVGVATIISGTPAAAPTVPELGDYVCSQLVLVQANLTIATNATAKLDKRVIYTPSVGQVSSVGAILDGGGVAIPANTIIYVRVPFSCTINEFTILANASGSITVKVYKDTYDNYPPTSADDISNGGLAVTSATKATDTTLTSWTTSITAGDVLAFTNTTLATTITRVTCQLKVTRT